ncbi:MULTISPECIES: Asp23/Gls24 family envelope stress response protein [unclassified Nocardioides]|uniref:Asp23/Gls24 family envelope stress response protein n=1 Tax=unclassified Nocardioides TaxID=2615069 RepID=UPI0030144F08
MSEKQSTVTTSAPATATTTDLERRASSALVSEQGRTAIADTVVSKIAGLAAREISGVHALGGGTARAVGAIRERIPGSRTNHSQGVAVEVGERQTAVDLDVVAEYGVAIADLAAAIRRNVISSVERMTGLEVTEVNITVHDVFVDDGSEADPEASSSRVE